jgi:hypothetical protein
MKSRAWWSTFLVSAVAGALVWAVSPWLTGQREPWDAGSLFYVVALVFAGALAGLLAPKPLWAHYLGAIVGQLGYELLFLRIGPLFVLGAAFLLGYCIIFVVAAAVAARLRARLGSGRSSSST